MADVEGVSSISISLSLIEKREKEYMVYSDGDILSFKRLLQSLETFHNISNDEDLKRSICEVSEKVMQKFQSLSCRPIDEGLNQDFENAYYNLEDQIKDVVTDPKTGECDIIFLNAYHKTSFDFVLKSLRELSSSKVDRNAPSIKEKMLLLHDFLAYIKETEEGIIVENREHSGLIIMRLVFKAESLLHSCLVGENEKIMKLEMLHSLSIIVRNIYISFFNRESVEGAIYLLDNVMKLLDYTSTLSMDLKDVCEKLHNKLNLLKTFLADFPHEEIVENFIHLSSFIEKITSAVLHIHYLCYGNEMKEDMFSVVNGALAEVIGQIEDIQAEVGDIKVYNSPKTERNEITLYNYPKTDALGFLDLFLGHVEELLKYQPGLTKNLKSEIESLKGEFDLLRSLLKNIKDLGRFEDLRTRIIHLAYQAEQGIDFYLVNFFSNRCIKFIISKIIEKSKLIQSEMTMVNDHNKNVSQAETTEKTFNNVLSHAIPLATDEVVGFEDEAEKIKELLFGDTKKRCVVSIVGLPGLGKTTLARKIYEDRLVIEHFDVRAWSTVSQTYRKRDVLLTILGNIERTEAIKTLNDDEELVEKLYKSLKGRRYLIVIDDLWNIEDWNDLARPFPDDKNQSRIIVTSRHHSVASQTKVDSKVHRLREFTDNESWELFMKRLFQNKLFHKESFSMDFQEVGIKIVERCKRLPLAIVVIASLLSNEKSVDKWKEIAANLRRRILSESESHCNIIFESSYNHLPDQLKSCFLYLGAFEEDEDIPLSKLKQLWIAEGFVRETGPKNLEDLAEEYCMDLMNRSLITPIKLRSRGGVRSCRVHDLIHEYCLEKAQEESFLQVMCVDDGPILSNINDCRRLRINIDVDDFSKSKLDVYSVRSLLSSTKITYYGSISLFFQNFKLLRVMDLGGVYIKGYFSGIEILIHLRYVAIKAKRMSIPSSLSNLWNLQYLLLTIQNNYPLVSVPDSLWDMVHLRNVNITYESSFEVHPRRLSNSVLLDNLHTLATPCLCYGEDAENLLRRLPKLQKLSCIFYIEDDTTELPQYPVLDFLDQLTSLKVDFGRKWLLQQKHIELNFPSNLKKVSLVGFRGYWDVISRMGRILPNLEVLKLDYALKEGEIWVLEDGDFPKLKYLKLYACYCEKWIASEDSFPILEKLMIVSCYRLMEIPPHFGDLPTLEMISVNDCYQSLCDSVREVQKNQEEWGNNELKVDITNERQ